MKKLFRISALLAVMAAVAGCYNDFDTPAPAKVYTDEDFAGMELKTIAEVKKMCIDEHGDVANTGENSSWKDTKYTQIPEDANYYIKGKVQSSDEEGNIYKSLHLVDETGAIELKLGSNLSVDYPMGHFDRETGKIPTHWVYVKIAGLYIGNYRMMLSLGGGPTDSYNKAGEHKFYANSNIENQSEVNRRVFLGEATELSLGKEILEITKDNQGSFFGQAGQDYLGRMVLIRDVACRYGAVGSNLYPSWMCTDLRPVESKYWYKWAVNETFKSEGTDKNIHCNYYGSVLFTYGDAVPSSTMAAGVFTVRTSGYSRFAKAPIVKDGARGDLLAIFGIYSKSWTYSFGAYQCSVNRFEDIMFDKDDFLTAEEAEALAPAGSDSWITKLTDDDYDE